MKQTTLEDLYYSNINPNETSFVRSSEYGKHFANVTQLINANENKCDNL